jgi:hypothetical protein
MAERTKFAAPGFAGGGDGGLGDVQINGVSIDNRRQHVLKRGGRRPGAHAGGAATARRPSVIRGHDRARSSARLLRRSENLHPQEESMRRSILGKAVLTVCLVGLAALAVAHRP